LEKVSTDYLVIEYVGKGQIMLGRSLLKLLGATIDEGKGTTKFTSPPCNNHVFPRVKSKDKRERRKRHPVILMLYLIFLEFHLSAPSSKTLKKSTLER
jgi:hypothetical protein